MGRFKMSLVAAWLGITVVLAPGCASIVHGSGQEVSISSDPSGAYVFVDGQKMGRTPMSANLKRKRSHQLVVHKDGYKDEDRIIQRVLSGTVAGNILAGGFIGWGVDAITGAQWRLVPTTLHVKLDPLPSGTGPVSSENRTSALRDRLTAIKRADDEGALTKGEADFLRRCVISELARTAPRTSPEEIPPDVRIVSLYGLLQKGLITNKEYVTTKKQILAEARHAENKDVRK